ncbi:hypothetical protein ACFL21_03360 [Patescibacteria group bacterium]
MNTNLAAPIPEEKNELLITISEKLYYILQVSQKLEIVSNFHEFALKTNIPVYRLIELMNSTNTEALTEEEIQNLKNVFEKYPDIKHIIKSLENEDPHKIQEISIYIPINSEQKTDNEEKTSEINGRALKKVYDKLYNYGKVQSLEEFLSILEISHLDWIQYINNEKEIPQELLDLIELLFGNTHKVQNIIINIRRRLYSSGAPENLKEMLEHLTQCSTRINQEQFNTFNSTGGLFIDQSALPETIEELFKGCEGDFKKRLIVSDFAISTRNHFPNKNLTKQFVFTPEDAVLEMISIISKLKELDQAFNQDFSEKDIITCILNTNSATYIRSIYPEKYIPFLRDIQRLINIITKKEIRLTPISYENPNFENPFNIDIFEEASTENGETIWKNFINRSLKYHKYLEKIIEKFEDLDDEMPEDENYGLNVWKNSHEQFENITTNRKLIEFIYCYENSNFANKSTILKDFLTRIFEEGQNCDIIVALFFYLRGAHNLNEFTNLITEIFSNENILNNIYKMVLSENPINVALAIKLISGIILSGTKSIARVFLDFNKVLFQSEEDLNSDLVSSKILILMVDLEANHKTIQNYLGILFINEVIKNKIPKKLPKGKLYQKHIKEYVKNLRNDYALFRAFDYEDLLKAMYL